MTVRDEVHELVDALSEQQLEAARNHLESLVSVDADPFVRFLREAPEDDELTTPEEDRAADEAWREYLREGGSRSENAKRKLLS